MEQNQAVRRTRRRRRRSPIGRLLTFCLICLVLFFGVSVFFQISVIHVEGITRYSRDEIIEAAGVGYGSRLFLVNSTAAENGIRSRLSHVETADVSLRFPGRVEITVKDARPLAAVRTDNGYLILDRECRVLQRGDSAQAAGLITIWGIDPILPTEGEILALGEEEREKIPYLRELLTALYNEDVAHRVERIDISWVNDLRLIYDDRFEVHFGGNRQVDAKVRAMIRVSETLGSYEEGIIDLSQGRNAYFRPDGP